MAGRRCLRSLHRGSRSGRSATATRANLGKGVCDAVDSLRGEIFEAIAGMDARTRGDRRPPDRPDGTETSPGRRQRHPRVQTRPSPRRPPSPRLPLYRYVGRSLGAASAGADDEHMERRRPADNPIDFQEFMVMPVGAASLAEAVRCGSEYFTRSRRSATTRASRPPSRRGRLAPNLASARDALDFIMKSVEQRVQRDDVVLALDCAATEYFRDGPTIWRGGDGPLPGRNADYLAALARRIRYSIEDGMPRTTSKAGRRSRKRSAQASTGRRRSVRDQSEAVENGHRPGPRQFDPDQGQPDRHAHRDSEAVEMAHRPATPRSCRTARARPGDTTIADLAVATNCGRSRPEASPAPTASPSTTTHPHREGAGLDGPHSGRTVFAARCPRRRRGPAAPAERLVPGLRGKSRASRARSIRKFSLIGAKGLIPWRFADSVNFVMQAVGRNTFETISGRCFRPSRSSSSHFLGLRSWAPTAF